MRYQRQKEKHDQHEKEKRGLSYKDFDENDFLDFYSSNEFNDQHHSVLSSCINSYSSLDSFSDLHLDFFGINQSNVDKQQDYSYLTNFISLIRNELPTVKRKCPLDGFTSQRPSKRLFLSQECENKRLVLESPEYREEISFINDMSLIGEIGNSSHSHNIKQYSHETQETLMTSIIKQMKSEVDEKYLVNQDKTVGFESYSLIDDSVSQISNCLSDANLVESDVECVIKDLESKILNTSASIPNRYDGESATENATSKCEDNSFLKKSEIGGAIDLVEMSPISAIKNLEKNVFHSCFVSEPDISQELKNEYAALYNNDKSNYHISKPSVSNEFHFEPSSMYIDPFIGAENDIVEALPIQSTENKAYCSSVIANEKPDILITNEAEIVCNNQNEVSNNVSSVHPDTKDNGFSGARNEVNRDSMILNDTPLNSVEQINNIINKSLNVAEDNSVCPKIFTNNAALLPLRNSLTEKDDGNYLFESVKPEFSFNNSSVISRNNKDSNGTSTSVISSTVHSAFFPSPPSATMDNKFSQISNSSQKNFWKLNDYKHKFNLEKEIKVILTRCDIPSRNCIMDLQKTRETERNKLPESIEDVGLDYGDISELSSYCKTSPSSNMDNIIVKDDQLPSFHKDIPSDDEESLSEVLSCMKGFADFSDSNNESICNLMIDDDVTIIDSEDLPVCNSALTEERVDNDSSSNSVLFTNELIKNVRPSNVVNEFTYHDDFKFVKDIEGDVAYDKYSFIENNSSLHALHLTSNIEEEKEDSNLDILLDSLNEVGTTLPARFASSDMSNKAELDLRYLLKKLPVLQSKRDYLPSEEDSDLRNVLNKSSSSNAKRRNELNVANKCISSAKDSLEDTSIGNHSVHELHLSFEPKIDDSLFDESIHDKCKFGVSNFIENDSSSDDVLELSSKIQEQLNEGYDSKVDECSISEPKNDISELKIPNDELFILANHAEGNEENLSNINDYLELPTFTRKDANKDDEPQIIEQDLEDIFQIFDSNLEIREPAIINKPQDATKHTPITYDVTKPDEKNNVRLPISAPFISSYEDENRDNYVSPYMNAIIVYKLVVTFNISF